MKNEIRVAVLGAGAWGTALATMGVRAGCVTTLYARNGDIASTMMRDKRHPTRLKDIALPRDLRITSQIDEALSGAHYALLVVPAQTSRAFLTEHRPHIPADLPIILCAKGLEEASGQRQDQIARTILPTNPLSVLSGPGFADDIAKGLPTAVTLAAETLSFAQSQAAILSSESFRIYANDDLIGVQLGGALKNVMALAVGAAHGAGLGASAEAALITRGFAEIKRLGLALGGRIESFDGLSGIGDLVLTCGSAQSRNFAYGLAMGRGEPLEDLPLAEGVKTAHSALETAQHYQIDVPIIEATARLLEGRVTIGQAVAALMTRPLNKE